MSSDLQQDDDDKGDQGDEEKEPWRCGASGRLHFLSVYEQTVDDEDVDPDDQD